MTHQMAMRELTDDERRWANPARWSPAVGALPPALLRLLAMFALCFAALMGLAGLLGPMAMKWDWNPEMPGWAEPVLVAVLWGPVLIVPIVSAVRGYRRRVRERRQRLEDARGPAQVLTVRGAGSVTLVDPDERTTHLFDLGTRTLLVDGACLEAGTGLSDLGAVDDGDDDPDAGEPEEADLPPLAFPNSAFVLHRLPGSGRILFLQLQGEPTPPRRVLLSNELPRAVAERLFGHGHAETRLIDSSLADLLDEQATA